MTRYAQLDADLAKVGPNYDPTNLAHVAIRGLASYMADHEELPRGVKPCDEWGWQNDPVATGEGDFR